MKKQHATVRFCGIAGDGIVTSGKVFSGAAADMGLDVLVNDNFSAEIRGLGKSTTDIRVSPTRVRSMGDGIDALVAMSVGESIPEIKDLKEDGFVIFDCDNTPEDREEHGLSEHIPDHLGSFAVPLKRLSNENARSTIARNIVSMGALSYLLGLPPDIFTELIERKLSKKGEKVVQRNIDAFLAGRSYCDEHYGPHTTLDTPEDTEPKKLVTGNQAVAQGALDCGLKFFAGYPITPATTIMEIVALELPKLGGWMLQAEDEIAALGAVVGASFAGKRAMTSTAGPGLALMSEMINMAVMSEIPIVIANVQRGGPSTGLPTKVEQGDLNIAMYGGSGDSPRVVMAPTNAEECYSGIQFAFDIAERFQTPVIFLSDLFLGQRTEVDLIERKIERDRSTRVKPSDEELANYHRFTDTDTGISPWVIPGEPGALYSVTGLEHSETGNPNFDAQVHLRMQEKRYRKFDTLRKELPKPQILGDEDAEIGLTCWGSVRGAVIEAMEIAREEGVKSKLIVSMMVNPQREDDFRAFFESCSEIIIPEMNHSGQYAALMKSRYGIRPREMHFPGVTPVSPRRIADKIKEVQNELATETSRLAIV
ncbi:MAG TPA: 2-oxoacid:acceptor oxidoreductase subunit alpha [Aridibacter sp.]|nr:2-oxoacid:acceptor oxidoreductase subunit alpha [Aridibacter sp.]